MRTLILSLRPAGGSEHAWNSRRELSQPTWSDSFHGYSNAARPSSLPRRSGVVLGTSCRMQGSVGWSPRGTAELPSEVSSLSDSVETDPVELPARRTRDTSPICFQVGLCESFGGSSSRQVSRGRLRTWPRGPVSRSVSSAGHSRRWHVTLSWTEPADQVVFGIGTPCSTRGRRRPRRRPRPSSG